MPARGAALTEDDFVVVSGPASPRVAFAVRQEARALTLVVDVTRGEAEGVAVTVGLAAGRKVVRTGEKAEVVQREGGARYSFMVGERELAAVEADWAKLRLGIAVAWKGGPGGQDRQRERFRHAGGAPHGGLSPSPEDWLPLDLAEHAALVADRKRRIALDFAQPMDGKATVVIEDETGRRVRNLVASKPLAKGSHRIGWDGLDAAGNVVSPGRYRWRAVSHPGIRPEYLFSFCNDGDPPWRTGSGTDMWGPDHSTLTAACAGRQWTFLGGSVAESGYAMVAVDAQGTKRMHYRQVHGTGLWTLALACDGRHLYAAHDGFAWGQHVDRSKPGWKATMQLTITRYDIATGKVVPYAGGKRFVAVSTFELGPGSANPKWDGPTLGGLAMLGGKLYVSRKSTNTVLELAADTCEVLGELPLDAPGALTARDGTLFAVSGTSIVALDPATKKARSVVKGLGQPQGLAVDGEKRLYVSGGETHTVKVFDAGGKPLREIGKRGGPYAGRYVAERMVHPRGLAVAPNGWLWVTEARWNPKRALAWDLASGKIAREKFGPTSYGASGAGVDPEDPTRWIGQGAVWKLDLAKKTARPVSILSEKPGHFGGPFEAVRHYAFHRQNGRTFLLALGGVACVSELMPDGSVRDLAFVGSTHRFCFGCNWKPPAAFVEAFERAYPNRKGKHADKGPGVLWVDRNGDGRCQADEFDFATAADNFGGAYWGHRLFDLTARVPATVKGRRVLVRLEPEGYHAGGAPKYPTLNEAIAEATPIDLDRNELETAVDRFGRLVCNSDPEMTCFDAEGKLVWRYPNRWTNVHGSHNAPLPERGVMQGVLFFLGMAPFDERGDVFVVNGNHGRFFVLTSDGFYLDEMFKDVRMGAAVDAYLIGGECFGGCFARAADGVYYLQSGHCDYRLFRIHGLAEARRSSGVLEVTPQQAIAAANAVTRRAAEAVVPREAAIPFRAKPPAIDGKGNDWPRGGEVRWDKSGKFPVTVQCAYDGSQLYLYYRVRDRSPWVNGGKDWTLLFKAGDSVDLQLATNAAADPTRRGPVPGDLRLLIAPFEGKPVAVLYRHRMPGAKQPVAFTSPWRSETVDSVERLADARIAVSKGGDQYTVEAAIPLKALGLGKPGGKTLKADFGVLYGDPDGAMTMLRSYWSNQATALVNDVPGEIMLHPNLWGTVRFEGMEPR